MPKGTLSRRRFLGTGSAAGVAAGLAPGARTLAQSTKVLRVRAYGALEILDPAYYLGRPEDDIMRCLCGGLITAKNGDEWAWEKAIRDGDRPGVSRADPLSTQDRNPVV